MNLRLLVLPCVLAAACGPDSDGRIDGGSGGFDAPVATPDAPVATIDAAGNPDSDPGAPDAEVTIDGMPGTSDLVINEVIKTHSGANTMEFLEIKGSPTTDYSAYSLLIVEGDDPPGPVGLVDHVYNVGTTDASGYWWTGYLNAQLEEGSLTVLLVKDWSGTEASTDIDGNDDGVIDASPPWTELVDDVAFNNTPATDKVYSAVDVGDLRGLSRIPDGTDTNMVSDFVESTDVPGGNESGLAKHTPGLPNEVVP